MGARPGSARHKAGATAALPSARISPVYFSNQYPASSWQYLPNILGEAFLRANVAAARPEADRPFVFLCVARLSPQKGIDLLLEAFAEAFCGAQNVRLRLVGDGPLLASLEHLGARLGIAPQIDFVGDLSADGVRAEMEAADAFALASRFETFGVVVIEALACGLPVVSTASGGPDHLIDASNGLLVPRADGGALRDALLQMRRAGSALRPGSDSRRRRPSIRPRRLRPPVRGDHLLTGLESTLEQARTARC